MNIQARNKHPVKFIRTSLVTELSGLSKSTLRRRIQEGLFVPPCSLGERAIAFLEFEVNTILTAMAAGKSTEEIKALVKSLVEQRQQEAADRGEV
jgi:predicted DNA-binding transcriptional regulator AlpA